MNSVLQVGEGATGGMAPCGQGRVLGGNPRIGR